MGKITDEVNPARPEETVIMQEEIRQTEAKISDTIHSIEEKFRPAHIKHELKEKLRETTVVGIARLAEAIRRRPAAAAAIGVGALWLIFRKKRHGGMRTATVIEALPKELKKDPVKALKAYITLGRLAVIVGSAVSTALLRERNARQAPRPPQPVPADIPRTGMYHHAMGATTREPAGTV